MGVVLDDERTRSIPLPTHPPWKQQEQDTAMRQKLSLPAMLCRRKLPPALTRTAVLILALGIAPGVAIAAKSNTIEGEATVHSGDVLEVAGKRFRLFGISAPKLRQTCELPNKTYPCGIVSQAALKDLTAGFAVRCEPTGRLIDGVAEARCTTEGFSLSRNMVHTGWALTDPTVNPDTDRPFADTEAEARADHRGLWRGKFELPWTWTAKP